MLLFVENPIQLAAAWMVEKETWREHSQTARLALLGS
jgi:hypothetical protein